MNLGKRAASRWLVLLGVAASAWVAPRSALAQPADTAIWTGEWTLVPPPGRLRIVQRKDQQAHGIWSGPHGEANLKCSASGRVLSCTWTTADGRGGTGVLTQTPDKKSASGVMQQVGKPGVAIRAQRISVAIPAIPMPSRPPEPPRGPLPIPDCAGVAILPACVSGDTAECYNKINHVRFSERNLPGAFCMALTACQRGHGQSCRTAEYLLDGRAFVKDEARTTELREAGCRGGDGHSCLIAAAGHAPKKTDSPDSEAYKAAKRKVFDHHARACTLGPVSLCTVIVTAYSRGGMPADQEALARTLVEKACAAKVVEACSVLATRKQFDDLQAECRKTKAAPACLKSADAFEYGIQTPKDPARAIGFLELGCAGGDCDSCLRRSRAAGGSAWTGKGAAACEKACAAASRSSPRAEEKKDEKKDEEKDEEEDEEEHEEDVAADPGLDTCDAAVRLLLRGKRTAATDKRAAAMLHKRCAASGNSCDPLAGLVVASSLPAAERDKALSVLDARCGREGGHGSHARNCRVREFRAEFAKHSAHCGGRDVSGCSAAAEILSDLGDGPSAVRLFGVGCRGGDPVACLKGAAIVDRGLYDAFPDPAQAALWRGQGEAACTGGHAGACKYLASMYRFGSGVPADKARAAALATRALQLFEQACDAGDATACIEAAAAYRGGPAAAENADKGLPWLEKGCALRNGEACRQAGWQYSRAGSMRPKDPAKAALLFEAGCRHGDASACGHLRSSVANGHVAGDRAAAAQALLAEKCLKKVLSACPPAPATGEPATPAVAPARSEAPPSAIPAPAPVTPDGGAPAEGKDDY